MKVLVAGSLHLDVVVQAPHLPRLDETVTGTGVDYVFGGKGGNQAVAAARMGAEVSFTGCVGSDGFGDKIRSVLKTSGIEVSQLQRDPGPSGMSTAIIDANGDYGAVIVSAANLLIDADRIEVPTQTALVLLQNEVPEAVNLSIARKARDAGAQVWLNAAPARDLSADLTAMLDLLIVNRVEAEFYRPASDGLPVLTTLGASGVSYQGQTYPGHDVKPISTHGAGDMFVGALAAQAAKGKSMVRGIEFAQAAAALHVSSTLTERAALTPEAVNAFLRT